MNLLYEMPGEGRLLTEGRLITEDGEPIDGVMITNVLRHGDHQSVSVQFTMMMERVDRMDGDDLLNAIRGVAELHEGLAE